MFIIFVLILIEIDKTKYNQAFKIQYERKSLLLIK